jgi:hypothetical protein
MTTPKHINFRFDPCTNCCGTCAACKFQLMPNHVQLEFSGIEDGNSGGVDTDCTNCDDLNSTWIVPASGSSSSGCLWTSLNYSGTQFQSWTCDNDQWQRITSIWCLIGCNNLGASFQWFGPNSKNSPPAVNNYYIELWLESDFAWPYYGPWVVWMLDLGVQDPPDCTTWDGLEIPYYDYWGNPADDPQHTGFFHGFGCDPTSSVVKITSHNV